MITEEERQSIIDEAVEKALLALPDVIGSLMMNQANLFRLNREFYKQYPDFVNSKNIVASVVEKVEGQYPGLDYKEVLSKAVPIIREQIKNVRKLDTKAINKPSRDLTPLRLTSSDHGEL